MEIFIGERYLIRYLTKNDVIYKRDVVYGLCFDCFSKNSNELSGEPPLSKFLKPINETILLF